MRTHRIWTLIGVGLSLLTGCRDITTTTRVKADGSCERSVAVKSKSKNFADSRFPIPGGPGWQMETAKDEADSTQSIYTARRSFASVAEMQQASASWADSAAQVKLLMKLGKKFRWFYTYHTYRETYRAYNVFHAIPIQNYFTEAELRDYDEDKEADKKKDDEWLGRNLFELLFTAMLEGAKDLNAADLTPEKLQANKEALYKVIVDDTEEGDLDAILKICEHVLDTRQVWRLKDPMQKAFEDIEQKLNFMGDIESNSYTNNIFMPGLIMDTNSESIKGNQVSWNIQSHQFRWLDYEMWVTSRTSNAWAFIVTLFALIIILVGLLLPLLKKSQA